MLLLFFYDKSQRRNCRNKHSMKKCTSNDYKIIFHVVVDDEYVKETEENAK